MVLAVVASHALVLAPVFGGSGTASTPPPRFGTPDTVQAVLIDDRSTAAIASPSLSPPVLRPIHVNLPDVSNRSKADSGLAVLYGRYLGQIDARVERAWLRPRSVIGAPLFRCQVELAQRRDGTVQTITLQRCNGTVSWQQSLVRGINAASPLPAPPDPRVFAHRVVLHFEAMAYRAGQSADEYEPERSPSVPPKESDLSEALAPLRSLGQAAQKPGGPSAIELRIDGSRIEVKPRH